MNKQLTAEEIFDIRDKMGELAQKIHNVVEGNSDTIPARIAKDLNDEKSKIDDLVKDLTNVAIEKLLTDLKNPAEKISKAIERLGKALKKINDFNEFLADLANVVNIVGIIATGVVGGIGSVNIRSAFQSLNDLVG